MSMSNLVVLSSRSQYDHFVRDYDLATFEVVCDSPGFSEFLASQKIRHTLLTEFLLAEQWQEVNAWACSRAAAWPELCKKSGLFTRFDYPGVMFHYFSHILTQMLKNFLYAQHIAKAFAVSRAVLFHPQAVDFNYPHFDGNFFLNYFLKEQLEQRGIEYVWCYAEAKARSRGSAKDPLWFAKTIKSFLKRILMRLLGRLNDLELGAQVLVWGSLRHLRSVLVGLKQKQQKIVFVDDVFQIEKFIFSLQNRIPYRIVDSVGTEAPSHAGAFRYFLGDAKKAMAQDQGFFVFRGRDFAAPVSAFIFDRMEKYFGKLEDEASRFLELLNKNHIKAMVVDEDYANRGSFLASFMKHHGVNNFCISHANVPVDFSVPEDDRLYSKSVTFVNSEFEKVMYQARGWDGSRIVVSGVPRYDRLVRLGTGAGIRSKSKSKRILVCGGPWWPHTPDELGYLGLHVECYREVQSVAMCELFSAVGRSDSFELLIKPHHIESEPYWRSFIRDQPKVKKLRLLKSTEDMLRLLTQCDVMVLSYWSTTIIEAAIVKLPVIFLNMRPTVSPALRDFSEKGFCRIAYNRRDIADQLASLPDRGMDPPLSESVLEYYLGKRDQHATDRVISEILKSVRPESGFKNKVCA